MIYHLKLTLMVLLLSACSVPYKSIEEEPLIIIHTSGNTGGIEASAGNKVAKRFGINAQYISHGCNVDVELRSKISKQNVKNKEAYKYYDKKFGKGWKQKFDQALYKETLNMAEKSFQEVH